MTTCPLTFHKSPRMAWRKDDFPAPTLPTTQVSSPFAALKLISSSALRFAYLSQENVPSFTEIDSSPCSSTAPLRITASGCSSSAVKNAVKRPTATEASMMDVITIGKIAKGKVRRLNSVKAGNTMSVVNGVSVVKTKTVKVEQETRNGVA